MRSTSGSTKIVTGSAALDSETMGKREMASCILSEMTLDSLAHS